MPDWSGHITLVGYSRREINGEAELKSLVRIAETTFKTKDFHFSLAAGSRRTEGAQFRFTSGLQKLNQHRCVSFYTRDRFAADIDNQAYRRSGYEFPPSYVSIDVMEQMELEQLLQLAITLIESFDLEYVIVYGGRERVGEYQTPLGIGLGLTRVNWIMCFGESYSRLIKPRGSVTKFFRNEEAGDKRHRILVSAATFAAYSSFKQEELDGLKKEMGLELFHRFPVEVNRQKSMACWIFSPQFFIWLLPVLMRALWRGLCLRITGWRKYQAQSVPDYFR
ncbi:MAG: hypothetical protein FD161_2387 [Limisphaerales bacterium]|nr:MAG: hypothetical protein FD161_2387 [Limisphaerales bacterium]KAG0508720.1 MAG: hypothetical protein E1N63_2138 [Limisphaerales bacterium]TXT50370.1 MAG: hypothetical protein FD140_2441 [Limisphaerales bacterium]